MTKKQINSLNEFKDYIATLKVEDNRNYKILTLSECEVNFGINLNCLFDIDTDVIQIETVDFKNLVSIESVNTNKCLCIVECKFENDFEIFNSEFSHEVKAYKDYKEGFSIIGCRLGQLSFVDCILNTSFKIDEVTAEHISFKGCKIQQRLTISQIKSYPEIEGLYSELSLIECTIDAKVTIERIEEKWSTITINDNVIAGDVLIQLISYQESKAYVSIYIGFNIIKGTIALNSARFKVISLKQLSLTGQIVKNNICFDELLDQETARHLKTAAITANDMQEMLYYRAEEYDFAFKEIVDLRWGCLKIKICDSRKWLFKMICSFGTFLITFLFSLLSANSFVLWMNKYSNNFSRSWLRGVSFTMVVAALFFNLINYWGIVGEDQRFFVINGEFNNFGVIWQYYLKMFSLIDFRDEFDGVKFNAWGSTLFLVSKIFIGYGIYQTISAFRKYGK